MTTDNTSDPVRALLESWRSTVNEDTANAEGWLSLHRMQRVMAGQLEHALAQQPTKQVKYDRRVVAEMLAYYMGSNNRIHCIGAIDEQIGLLLEADTADAAGVRTAKLGGPPCP